MKAVAQSWLVLELTDSPFRLGLVGALQFTPILFLSILAGPRPGAVPAGALVRIEACSTNAADS